MSLFTHIVLGVITTYICAFVAAIFCINAGHPPAVGIIGWIAGPFLYIWLVKNWPQRESDD